MNTAEPHREMTAGDLRPLTRSPRGRTLVRAMAALVALALSLAALLATAGGTTAATPSASATSTAQSPAADSATPSTPSDVATPTAAAGFSSISVAPSASKIAVGASVTVDLTITSSADIGSVTATLKFDPKLLQVEKIVVGPIWVGAPLHVGLGTVDDAIAQAKPSAWVKLDEGKRGARRDAVSPSVVTCGH